MERRRIRLNGIVQGVGFRPFVYQLATELELSGFVRNDAHGLLIEVQGPAKRLDDFYTRLLRQRPALARIDRHRSTTLNVQKPNSFTIRPSLRDRKAVTGISPDVAVCTLCLQEMADPRDRRYHYPFINCTHCGPRYTIIRSLPYDRPNTSMAVFPLCPQCRQEYESPENRRFHAQPNACPVCGPRLTLYAADGRPIDADPLFPFIWQQLHRGAILAVRGIGGFHLCADAHNGAAVQTLRLRKGREEKPLAIMVRDRQTVERYCRLDETENELLFSAARPIVLLQKKETGDLACGIAPGNRYLGVMAPYAPLHHLLLSGPLDSLIMTSANFSEEPIAIANAEALQRLNRIADYFLFHDREILQRCDDSVARVILHKPILIRRSRGYVPEPVHLARRLSVPVLACGGELKNTIALARDREVFLSQHIGDLTNPPALAFFQQTIDHLQQVLEIEPAVIACDLHPDYLSTQWAQRQKKKPLVCVQHHHGHLVSVMAENHITQPCIGVILDGSGYGLDGTVWGGEVLIGDARSCNRFAWLQPVPMPGGEAAIRQPWRMTAAYLYAVYGDDLLQLDSPLIHRQPKQELTLIMRMMATHTNCPITSSCGRLFDAVAGLLGLREEISYEAQAAVELEMLADEQSADPYPTPRFSGSGALATDFLIRRLVEDWSRGVAPALIAQRFHATLAEIFVQACRAAREKTGIPLTALSGGVFQNRLFFHLIHDRLQKEGFKVISHHSVPTNDGGLALGQAVIAAAQVQSGKKIENHQTKRVLA